MKTDTQQKSIILSSPTFRAKKVSFADVFGLKLEVVKTTTPCNSEDNLCELHGVPDERKNRCDVNGNIPRVQQKKCLLPCFVAPSRIDGFMRRLHAQNVCLENITCEKFVVSGLIRVTNLSYRKEVNVRFTLDGWETYRDIWADYMSSCSDGKNDKFTFRITVPFDFEVNRHMEFAIRYRVLNQEFWDNNDGKNYHVQCLEFLSE